MIELTPLDVRKKRGDFRRAMRGFDSGEVDAFLELVAERMESLVTENLTLKERSARLQDQVREQGDREKAVQEALVTAQELRKDISGQAHREAELIKREAESEIERMLLDAEHRAEELRNSAVELERRRRRFLRAYHQYLERELDEVERESARHPLDTPPLELDLDGSVAGASVPAASNGSPDARSDGPSMEAAPDTETLVKAGPESIDESTEDAEGGNGQTVTVESLAPESPAGESGAEGSPSDDAPTPESSAPESRGVESEDRLKRGSDSERPGTTRVPTEVSSDPVGDPDVR